MEDVMNKLYRSLSSFSLIYILTVSVLFVHVRESRGENGGTCLIAFTKVAEGGEGLIFRLSGRSRRKHRSC